MKISTISVISALMLSLILFTGCSAKLTGASLNSADKDVQLLAVQTNPMVIQYIENPDKDVQLAAIRRGYIDIIRYIKNPDKEVQLAAVKKDGRVIEYIKNPDKDVQLAAVQYYGILIKYIKNPDKDLQLAAVRSHVDAIQYINNPDKDVQLTAVRSHVDAIQYINNPDKDVQLTAVVIGGYAIKHIKNPDKDVQLVAVKKDRYNFKYIKNPSLDVQLFVNGYIYTSKKPNGFKVKDKNIEVRLVNNSTIEIVNSSSKFVNIKKFSEYYGSEIVTINDITAPPQGVKTIPAPNTNKHKVNSLNEPVVYGYAVEYQMSGDKVNFIYETNNFLASDLLD